jgi:putative inorganic carbon (HCO3(-)) transporter
VLSPANPRSMPAPFLPPRGAFGGNRIAPPDSARRVEGASAVQFLAFRMALVLVFIRFSIIHQLLTYLIHVNLYLLYLFGIPTLLGVVLAGGVQRTLRGRPAVYWTVFAVWLIAGIPFSSWRGGSAGALNAYIRTDFPMLFVIAGLTLTWRECQSMMRAIAASTVIIMSAGKLFQDNSGLFGERLAINFGTISNSNDYACHLVLVLPFVIWIGLTAKSKALRLASWGWVGYGVLLALKTASRGAFLALIAGALYWLFRGTMRQRIGLLAAGPIVVFALIVFVPRSSLIRIVSFSATDAGASQEALESTVMRRYLLEQSIVYTLQHPIFGVGLAQFGAFEGEHNQIVGTHGSWHETHNTYTQVSSECGMPALALFIAGIGSTFLLMNRVYRQARKRPECEDLRIAAFCIMMAMTTCCTAITFVNFAYFFYLPAMSSLAIAVYRAAQDEFANRSSAPVEPQPGSAQQRWLPQRKPVAPAAR